MENQKTPFSKQNIQDKQQKQKEEYTQKINELRKSFEDVASTASGEKVLRYVYLICGGDIGSIRRKKEGDVDINDTLISLGTKAVWDTLRYNFKSETLMRIERHGWEE